jgi:hypothetical protein
VPHISPFFRPALISAALLLATGVAMRGFPSAAESARFVPPPVLDELASAQPTSEVAVLAGGCFWGVQGYSNTAPRFSRPIRSRRILPRPTSPSSAKRACLMLRSSPRSNPAAHAHLRQGPLAAHGRDQRPQPGYLLPTALASLPCRYRLQHQSRSPLFGFRSWGRSSACLPTFSAPRLDDPVTRSWRTS